MLSAYVQPIAERYLDAPRRRRSRRGASTGSSTSCSRTAASTRSRRRSEIPITMVESGPASGFWGAAELGRLIGEPNVLALDIGGTTAKCSLIEDGHVKIMTDYWIEREPPLGRLSDHGAGGRPRRDRQRRRQHRLGRRLRQAARRAAVGRRGARARPPTAAAAPRRRRPTPTSRSAGSTATTSAAARSTPTWPPSSAALDAVARQARRRAGRGGARHRPHRQQQHDQRAEAGLAQPRLRPARLHARRLRRRRRHARGRARRRARHPQGRHPARGRRVLGVGDADERPPPRLLRHPPRRPERRDAADGIDALLRRDRRDRARASSRARAIAAGQVRFLPLRQAPLPEPGAQRRGAARRTARSTTAAGRAIEATFHDAYEREYTYRLDAPVEFVGVHLVALAEVGKLAPAQAAGDRRGRSSRRSKGQRNVDYATEGIHEAAIYDGELLEPGMTLRRAGDRRDAGHDDRRPSRQPGRRSTTTATSTSI